MNKQRAGVRIVIFIAALIFVIIVGFQIKYFSQTRTGAQQLRELFPDYTDMAAVSRITSQVAAAPDSDGLVPASAGPEMINVVAPAPMSSGFAEMLHGINRYLNRNAGMPVTFLVLQDIVERTTEEYEQTAAATVALPLYLGLMGTFAGVITGLLGLGTGNGPSMEDTDLRRFISGVLVAMTGSLLGLVLYVWGRRLVAKAQSRAQIRKRDFFIFLQSELLPAAGKEVAAALHDLSGNLTKFNQDFTTNLRAFGTAMDGPANALRQQRELLQALEKTDLKQLLEANVSTIKAMKTAAPVLQAFLESTSRFVVDLEAGRQIAADLNALLDRVRKFEDNVDTLAGRLEIDQFAAGSVVDLIRKQLETLTNRHQVINEHLAVQETTIQRGLREQSLEVHTMISNFNQQIATAGDDLSRSLKGALGGDKAGDLMRHISRLDDIAQRTDQSQKALTTLAARPDNRTQEQLLVQILAELRAQTQRTLVPQFVQRFFPGNRKGDAHGPQE